ncbi:MAG: TonB-dependent receptor [Bacteroidota bacterium]
MTDLKNKIKNQIILFFQNTRKPLMILILSILTTGVIWAQNKGIVTGVISDAQSGETLIGANVILEGTSFGTATNIDGEFIIANVPAGDYTLLVSYIGYDNKTTAINVVAGEKTTVNLSIAYSGIELGAVEVTAQARGQLSAINNQLNSKDIRNVVSAERIQELPDANAAETIGRMSGVSVLRSGGEGNKVVIRGMSPKYNKITIEGVSMSGGGGDRSVDISAISPYSLDGIEVMKAVTPDKDADYIGGAVNFKLRTGREGWSSDFVVQKGYNDLKGTMSDYVIVGSIDNRFFDNKLGVYLQGNIEQRNRSANQLSASYNVHNDAVVGEQNPVWLQNLTLSDVFRKRTRKGATLVLDYKLNDGVIHFKNLYNGGNTDIDRYNQQYGVNNRMHTYMGRIDEYALSSFTNVFDIEKRFGAFTIDAKASHSFNKNENPNYKEFLFQQHAAIDPSTQIDPYSPSVIINELTEIDDDRAFFNYAKEGNSKTEERQIGASVNLKYDFTLNEKINGNIKIGGKYRTKNRFYDREAYGSDLVIHEGQYAPLIRDAFPEIAAQTPENISQLPFSLFSNPEFDHRNYMDGEYSMGAVPDLELMTEVLQVLKDARSTHQTAYEHHDKSSATYDYSGNEYFNAAYLMADINFGPKIKLIPGVRYEKNKTRYTAVNGVTNIILRETGGYPHSEKEYTRVNDFLLPMVHLKVTPTDWFDIRFAYTQTLSRPSYYQVVPRLDVYSARTDDVWLNNYNLQPEESENFDLYLSFHEDHIGLFTIGGFYKKIDNMIFNLGSRIITDTTGYNLPSNVDVNKLQYVSTYANNKDQAKNIGFELDWQTNFWYLPGALKGIVLNVNYTHIFSEAKYPYTYFNKEWNPAAFKYDLFNVDTFYTSPLMHQPNDIVNVQLGYDYKGFSARVSMLYQAKIFKNPNFWPELSQYTDDYLRWDLSVKQKLPWYGMQLFCNINNITGAKDRDLVQGARYDASIQHYGMTVDLGLRIKL